MRLAILLAMALSDSPGGFPTTAVATGTTEGPTAAATATLLVAVSRVRSSEGQLVVAVFITKEGWPKPARAARTVVAPAAPGDVIVRVEGLPPGRCAVSVIHDLNRNGRLDMRWFPFPRPAEPVGASNGARGRLGPPGFEEALIDCPAGETAASVTLDD